MSDDFLDSVIRFESVVPGAVFGMVDIVYCACGKVSTLICNSDGSNT